VRTTLHARLLARVGMLYYVHGKTQREIADEVGISRPCVSRLLREARDAEIVRIDVAYGEASTSARENLMLRGQTSWEMSHSYLLQLGPATRSRLRSDGRQ
jgi:DNA-binding transcriptional regulator LsrR (DeoR family)